MGGSGHQCSFPCWGPIARPLRADDYPEPRHLWLVFPVSAPRATSEKELSASNAFSPACSPSIGMDTDTLELDACHLWSSQERSEEHHQVHCFSTKKCSLPPACWSLQACWDDVLPFWSTCDEKGRDKITAVCTRPLLAVNDPFLSPLSFKCALCPHSHRSA